LASRDPPAVTRAAAMLVPRTKQDSQSGHPSDLLLARSATVADGGPFRACIGKSCSPPSPSIGRTTLVLPQETCPGPRACCIHEAGAVSRANSVPPGTSAPGRRAHGAAVEPSQSRGRRSRSTLWSRLTLILWLGFGAKGSVRCPAARTTAPQLKAGARCPRSCAAARRCLKGSRPRGG
jgi:hypothetical protein